MEITVPVVPLTPRTSPRAQKPKRLPFVLWLLATIVISVSQALNASAAMLLRDTAPQLLVAGTWQTPVRSSSHLEIANQDARSLIITPRRGDTIVMPHDGEILYRGTLDWVWGDGVLIKHSDSLYSVITVGRVEVFNAWRVSPGRKLPKGTVLGQIDEDVGNVEWTLFGYIPEASSKPREGSSRSSPISFSSQDFEANQSHAFNLLVGSPVLQIEDLVGMGRVSFETPTDLWRSDRAQASLSTGLVTNSLQGPVSLLLEPGVWELKITQKGFLFDSVATKPIAVMAGATLELTLGNVQSPEGRAQLGIAEVRTKTTDRPNARTHLDILATLAARLDANGNQPGGIQSSPVASATNQPNLSGTNDGKGDLVAGEMPRAEQQLTPSAVQAAAEEARRQALAMEASQTEALRKAQAIQAEQAAEEMARLRAQLEQLRTAQQARDDQAQQRAAAYKPGRRKALVIGNDVYARVPKLEAARADAKAIGQALSSVGFDVSLHTDLSERAMKRAMREFKAKVEGGDEVAFFFAGHGVQIDGINYLLPVDIAGQNEDQVRDEAVPLQRILDDMDDRKAGFMLAMIDACRDNPFRTTGRAIGGRGLAPTSAATGQMIIFSAGTGQQALDRLHDNDSEPNGVFTRVFLREMVKPGISVDRVLRNVRQEVVQLARSVGKEQTPALYDQAVGDFFFKP
jgi:hypothetical protein